MDNIVSAILLCGPSFPSRSPSPLLSSSQKPSSASPSEALSTCRSRDDLRSTCLLYLAVRLPNWSLKEISDVPAPCARPEADRRNVKHIFKTNFDNYRKRKYDIGVMKDLLVKQGIFTVHGETWKKQRKVTSFEFATRVLRDFSCWVFRSEASQGRGGVIGCF